MILESLVFVFKMVARLGVVERLDDCPASVDAECAAYNAPVAVSVIIQEHLDGSPKI